MRAFRAPGPARSSVSALVSALLLALVLTGCSAEPPGSPRPSATVSVVPPSAPVSVPPDGARLREFGYAFGPLDTFSLPRGTVLSASVNQADNVTAVLSAPAALEVAAYLRRALPGAGFRVTADDAAASTLTFTGHGWSGSFTGNGATSAVLLRPL